MDVRIENKEMYVLPEADELQRSTCLLRADFIRASDIAEAVNEAYRMWQSAGYECSTPSTLQLEELSNDIKANGVHVYYHGYIKDGE